MKKIFIFTALFITPLFAFANTIERVSLTSVGGEGNGVSYFQSISEDGRYIAFVSLATNLVANDTNAQSDIFVYDVTTDTLERVSVSSAGAQANSYSSAPAISPDGRYVAFYSGATNLVTGDTNAKSDIFVYDRDTDAIERISVSDGGTEGNNNSFNPVSMSDDAQFVVFYSDASNLVGGDTNGVTDSFVYDRDANTIQLASLTYQGVQANGNSQSPVISSDGRYVAFWSTGTNLVAGDTNAKKDIFIRDLVGSTTERISVSDEGTQTDGDSYYGTFSDDGRYVAFYSDATNLVSGDTNAKADVFVYDRDENTVERVSVSSAGVEGNNNSYAPMKQSISSDGRYVTFYSDATNLVSGDTNAKTDIFVHDRTLGTTERVSLNTNGEEGNGNSPRYGMSAITPDGRFISFESSATNFVASDTNAIEDVFLVDRAPTLTVTTTVTNDDGRGSATVTDFPLYLDGVAITSAVATTTLAGTHTLTYGTPAGPTYDVTWGGTCATNGTLITEFSSSYTCTLTANDSSSNTGGGGGGSSRRSTSTVTPSPTSPVTPPASPTTPLTSDERTKLITELKTQVIFLIQQLVTLLREQLAGMTS